MYRFSFKTLTLGNCLQAFGIVLLIVLVTWYVQFQARNFLNGPQITLSETGGIMHHERTISLRGTAQNIVKLTLNGKEIHTDEHGLFTHPLILEDGYSIVTLVAQDRFGRSETLTRTFVYAPEVASEQVSMQN